MQNNFLTIGSYNIKRFTLKKFMENKDIIKNIINRFDVIFLLEIIDKDDLLISSIIRFINQNNNKVIKKIYKNDIILYKMLNCKYNIVSTPLLGKTRYKEKIYLIYDNSIITIKDCCLFLKEKYNIFERSPIAVRFCWNVNPKKNFSLICTHTKPSNVKEELEYLNKIYLKINKKWEPSIISKFGWLIGKGKKDVIGPIIIGDLNAGNNYIPKKDRKLHVLWNNKKLIWKIRDTDYTNISSNGNAYDRIIINGKYNEHFDDNAEIIKNINNNISDHYPISIKLFIKKKY